MPYDPAHAASGGTDTPPEEPSPEPPPREDDTTAGARPSKVRPINGAKRRARAFLRGDHVELGDAMLAQLRERGEVVFDDGDLYRYEPERHVFEIVPEAEQSQIVQSFAGTPVGEKRKPLALKRTDVTGSIRLAWDAVSDVGFFAAAPPGLVFTNAFVEVSASGIAQHAPLSKHRARFSYPFAFVSDALPKRWIAFLAEVFRDDTDASDKIKLLQEYIGASLLGLATRYQRVLVVYGPGANGKSVLMSVVEAAMPPGAACSIPPQDWGSEYRLAMLAGKRVNLVAELPEGEILAAESFKSVVSGDSMTGRHIRQAPFTFRPVAGHIFAGNRLPGTVDQTHGFWRRILVVPFDRVFAPSDQNPRLAEELLEAELPEIVSWFLVGAARVLAQRTYTVPPSSAGAVDRWRRHADPVRALVEEWTTALPLDSEPAEWTPAAKVYSAYRAWAYQNGHRALASNSFGQRMELLEKPSKKTRAGWRYPVALETYAFDAFEEA